MLEKLSHIPESIHQVEDYLAYAEARLDPAIWDYLQQGSGNNISRERNRLVFEQSSFIPRPLSRIGQVHTRCSLFGQDYQHPILLAPIAYQKLFHPMGEIASAMAAHAQGGNMLVSSLASQPLEQIIEAAEQPLWFQLYWQHDRASTLVLLKRALAAGYQTIVFTVDAPVKQARLTLPDSVRAVNLPNSHSAAHPTVADWMALAPDWSDLAWLREQCPVPLIVKGILHPTDAQQAEQLGCDGVIVSNHGGRVLDGTPASLQLLPNVVSSINIPVLFDSGIRNGRDVYTALNLGAQAVLVGRPYIWGLASCGPLGVAHVLRLMRDELEQTLALCGQTTLEQMNDC